jgi:hypothetical protein
MSYLICEECGKQYPLPEGETSFYYQNCSCGGKLKYSTSAPKQINHENKSQTSLMEIEDEKKPASPRKSVLKWKGVLIGLLFLFVSLILSVLIIFGNNIPRDPTNIPIKFLTYFSVLTIILTIASGSISAYLSGSKIYLDGAINGGMVGVLLGLILGLAGGFVVFISGTLVFGLLSMAGGIIGTFPRKISKK